MVWDSLGVSTGQTRAWRMLKVLQWYLNVHTMRQAHFRSFKFMLGRPVGATQTSVAQDGDFLPIYTFNNMCTQQSLGLDSPEIPFLFRSWKALNMQEAQAGPMLINHLD